MLSCAAQNRTYSLAPHLSVVVVHKMKVLITGGSGRIASHLIPFLQKHSHDAITAIITLDRRPAPDVLKFDQQNSTDQSDEQANVEPTTEKIPILHRTLDLIADPIDRLEEAFDGVHAVIHLGNLPFA